MTTFISSLDSDGFTVKNDGAVNTSSTVYYYLAIRKSTDCAVGTYSGTGADKEITTNFQPEIIFIIPDFASWENVGVCISMRGKPTEDMKFSTGDPYDGDMVKTWGASSFTVDDMYGSSNLNTYHYVANDNGSAVTTGTYNNSGTPADNTDVTIAFQPSFLLLNDNSSNGNWVYRFSGQSGDKSFDGASTAAVTDRIQAFNGSPAGYQVGANASVNNPSAAMYYMGLGTSTLPVELIEFDAKIEEDQVIIEWSTASEINSENFSVMRSTDGVSYESIGELSAAGTSNHILYYNFIDEHPAKGLNYYKLLEKDYDGKTQESKVVGLNFNQEINVITQLYPNPSSNNIALYYNSITGGVYKLTITDINGNAMYFAHIPSMIGENKFKMSVEPYDEGTYFINLTDPSGVVSSVKVMKKN